MWYDTYQKQFKKSRYKLWLTKGIIEKGKNHDEVFEDNWMDKKDESLNYVRNDVLCTDFAYATYIKGKEKVTGCGMKNSLKLLSLGRKKLNSLRDENDEPIYT